MNNEDLDKSIIKIDFNLLKRHLNTQDSIICFCPECINKVGKEDTSGKLYIKKDFSVGWCFRCKTVFINDDVSIDKNSIDFLSIENTVFFKNKIEFLSEKILKELFKNEYKQVPVFCSDLDYLNDSQFRYLSNRNPYLPILASSLGFKGFHGNYSGIFIPFLYKEKICKYQIRYLNNPKLRYYTSPGTIIPYSPKHILYNLKPCSVKEITVCEGVFDAISLEIMGYKNVFAILGSYINKTSIEIIRNFLPETIYLAMDSIKLNFLIKNQLKRALPSVSKYISVEFPSTLDNINPDPEEYLKFLVKTDKEKRLKFNISVKNWLNSVN